MATRSFCVGLLLTITFCLTPQHLRADGNEFSVQGDDLSVTVDTRWVGGLHGGYYPLRIFLENTGEARDLTVEFASEHGKVPKVTRSTHLEQNGREFFSLPIPLVGVDINGQLKVLHNGQEILSLTRPVQIPAQFSSGSDRPALLVIAPQSVDCQAYEHAVNYLLSQANTSLVGGGPPTTSRGMNHQWIFPTMLPTRWLDYSGVDIVAVPQQTLATMTEQSRGALLKWVHTGGTLLVYSVNQRTALATEAISLTGLDEHSSAEADWTYADPQQHVYIPLVQSDSPREVNRFEGDGRRGMRPEWPSNRETFARKSLMMGRVYFFRGNPFPGSHHDWNWFLQDLTEERAQWTTRHGMSARQDNSQFLNFLNPGVKGVPVYSFLVLISLFTFIIGPLNYYVLWRKKKLYLLLITIPVIACVTSLCLFSYSLVAHGFSVKSRARTVTVLDQKSNTAVTMGRVSLFAGFVPSDGLEFSAETAVYPIWPEQQGFESGTVDWTETQAMKRGWLRSRTRTQFLTVTHRPERGRLNIHLTGSGSLNVENGLEWDIEAILVRDENGTLYYGKELVADDSLSLKQATNEDLESVLELSSENSPEMPESVTTGNARNLFNFIRGGRRRYYYGQELETQFSRGLLEKGYSNMQIMIRQKLFRTNLVKENRSLPNKSYVAILKDNPGVELGVNKTKAKGDSHLLLGFY